MADARAWPRVLGQVGAGGGPTLVALGGIHGNEPAGLLAAERVLARMERERMIERGLVRGTFVALAGNRGALAAGARYLARDLNRGWNDAALAVAPGAAAAAAVAEDHEQAELHEAIREAYEDAPADRRYFVDLHTTSAPGVPFVVADGAEPAQAFALTIPLPTFFGLIGKLSSALMPYLVQQGVIGIAVEGGQHEASSSVDHHEAVLWIALVAAGVLAVEALPDVATFRALLVAARHGLPQAIDVYHRHGIVPEDEFRMAPGFANLQPITRGTLLARDRRGEIRAPEDCLLVMPLYQGLGDDGFFLGREVREPGAAAPGA